MNAAIQFPRPPPAGSLRVAAHNLPPWRTHRLGGTAPRSPQVLCDEVPSGGVAGAGGHAHGVESQSAGAGVAEDPGHEVLHAADVQGLRRLQMQKTMQTIGL